MWKKETIPRDRKIVLIKGRQLKENHEHNDVGQLCVDGYGERLIVDLGSPSGYPADFFEENRWKYYNASIKGHNVLMFNGREMRVPRKDRGSKFFGYAFPLKTEEEIAEKLDLIKSEHFKARHH